MPFQKRLKLYSWLQRFFTLPFVPFCYNWWDFSFTNIHELPRPFGRTEHSIKSLLPHRWYNLIWQVNITLIDGDVEVFSLVLSEFILILDDIDCFVLCLPGMLLIIVKAPWGHIRLFGQPKNFQLSQMNITKVSQI